MDNKRPENENHAYTAEKSKQKPTKVDTLPLRQWSQNLSRKCGGGKEGK